VLEIILLEEGLRLELHELSLRQWSRWQWQEQESWGPNWLPSQLLRYRIKYPKFYWKLSNKTSTSQSSKLTLCDACLSSQDGNIDCDGEFKNQQPDDKIGFDHFSHALLEHVNEENDTDRKLGDSGNDDEGNVLVEVFGVVVLVSLASDWVSGCLHAKWRPVRRPTAARVMMVMVFSLPYIILLGYCYDIVV